jgi:hypothetical protein
LLEVREISRIINVFKPAIALHPARLCFGDDFPEEVKASHIGRPKILEDRPVIILGVNVCIVAALEA